MDQKKLVQFLSFWVVNAIVLIIADSLFGINVELGNDKVSGSFAAVVSALIITGVNYFVPQAVAKSGYKVKDQRLWGVIYYGANIFSVWVLKHLALILGFGVANLLFTVLVGALLSVAQYATGKLNKIEMETPKAKK